MVTNKKVKQFPNLRDGYLGLVKILDNLRCKDYSLLQDKGWPLDIRCLYLQFCDTFGDHSVTEILSELWAKLCDWAIRSG